MTDMNEVVAAVPYRDYIMVFMRDGKVYKVFTTSDTGEMIVQLAGYMPAH